MSTKDSTPDGEAGFKFLEALLGGAPKEPEPEPVDAAEVIASLGDTVQSIAAIALGVRARAIEAGVSPANADAMAMSTYAVSLQGLFGGGANG